MKTYSDASSESVGAVLPHQVDQKIRNKHREGERPSSIQWRQEATNAWKKQEKETTKSTREATKQQVTETEKQTSRKWRTK